MTKYFSKTIFLLILFVFSLRISAYAFLPPKFGGTLTVSMSDRISKVNPSTATSDHEFNVIFCIFEPLVAPQEGGGFVPVLLESLPVASDDGMKYYLKLREGVSFHDGNELDSADVAHSFKKLIKNRKSPYTWIFDSIAGADDFREGKSGTVEGIRITDPMRLEITLSKADRNFISYLAFPAAVIVATSENDYEPPIGTGPFIYYDRTSRGDIVLNANMNYRNGRPYLDRIEFRPLRDDKEMMISFWRGELDVLEVPLGGIEENDFKGLSTSEVISPMKRMYFMDVNPVKVTGGTAVRESISAVVDRDGITNVLLRGKALSENNMKGKGDPGKMVKAIGGKFRTIWYGESEKNISKVAAKVAYDFETRGITLKQYEGTELGIRQYSQENAPEFIVRSLPVLLGKEESLSEVLFGRHNLHSRESSMFVRIGAEDKKSNNNSGSIIMMFSSRRSYLYNETIKGIESGAYGNIIFENVYMRGESQRLDN